MREWFLIAAVAVVILLAMAAVSVDRDAIITSSVIGVSAQCKDGMYSTSEHDRGTCSGHGGVKRWIMQ